MRASVRIKETGYGRIRYGSARTALLFVDPYNDFLSEGGKLWPQVEAVARSLNLLANLRSVVAAARDAGIQVVIVPHHRWEPGDYAGWDHATPYQISFWARSGLRSGNLGRRMASGVCTEAWRRCREGTLGI